MARRKKDDGNKQLTIFDALGTNPAPAVQTVEPEPAPKANPRANRIIKPSMCKARFLVQYYVYTGGGPSSFKCIKEEHTDKKPSQAEMKRQGKKLNAYSVQVFDCYLPELLYYYMLECDDMLMVCPADEPGCSITNEPLRYFHLLDKLPKSYLRHMIISHQITVGHALNKKHKAKLHDDGLPKRRDCVACGKKFRQGEWTDFQFEYDGGDYGQICCSVKCYMDAEAAKHDWPGYVRDNDGKAYNKNGLAMLLKKQAKEKMNKPAQSVNKSPKQMNKSADSVNAPGPDVNDLTKTCPDCGVEGSIDELFGYRKSPSKKSPTGFKLIPQSYCHKCR